MSGAATTILDRPAAGLAAGARNLLQDCAGLRPGQRVAVVREDPRLGWFDDAAPDAVEAEARRLGAAVVSLRVGGPAAPPPGLAAALARADIAVFFARIGDHGRFCAAQAAGVAVVSYARTAVTLGGAYGTRPHRRMRALKAAADAAFRPGAPLRVTCPRGTDVAGAVGPGGVAADVRIRRFPLCVPAPTPAAGLSGRVALPRWLTPTGASAYEPAALRLSGRVFAHLEDGRIAGFEGPRADIRRIEAHYLHVAGLFGLDPWAVHSWHAGIHDGCPAWARPGADPDLWANTVFGSPRYLHFHSCGAAPPGEISWMVRDPTVEVDGVALWDRGRLAL